MSDDIKLLELVVERPAAGVVTLTIRDNGVGRAAARKAAAKQATRRKSVGLDITRQRLRHFARKHGRGADFEIRDLVLADGAPGGTEVVIRLLV